MYSLDIRKVALHMYSILCSLRKVASLLNIHYSTVCRWLKNLERKPYTFKDESQHKTVLVKEAVKTAILVNPLTSIRKIRSCVLDATHVSVSHELIRTVISSLGFTKKKAKFFSVPKNQSIKISEFLEARERFKQQNKTFVSIDETAFGRNWGETRGYAPKGQPLYSQRKKCFIKTTSVLAASTASGWMKIKQQQGSFNTESFLAFVKELDLNHEQVVLLDNVSFHHSKIVKAFFAEQNIQTLYTPPYCPWFNPIENCFSIVKRKFPVLEDVQASFDAVSEAHFRAFFDKSLCCVDKY